MKHRLWGFWSLAIPATRLDEGVPTKSPDEEVTKISRGQSSPDSETGTPVAFIQNFQGQCPIVSDGRGDTPVSPVSPTHDRIEDLSNSMWTCRGRGQRGLKNSWVKFANRSP